LGAKTSPRKDGASLDKPQTASASEEEFIRVKQDAKHTKQSHTVIEIDSKCCGTRVLDLIVRSLYKMDPIEVTSPQDASIILPLVRQAASTLELDNVKKMADLQLKRISSDRMHHKQEALKKDWEESINSKIHSLFFHQKLFSNVIIRLKDGHSIHAHSAILSTRCEKIRRLIPVSPLHSLPADCELEMIDKQDEEENTMTETKSDIQPPSSSQIVPKSIEFLDVSPTCAQLMISLFYGASMAVVEAALQTNVEMCVELMVQSHKHGLFHLRNVAAEVLLSMSRSHKEKRNKHSSTLSLPRNHFKTSSSSSSSSSCASSSSSSSFSDVGATHVLHLLNNLSVSESDETLVSFLRLFSQQISSLVVS